MRSFAKFSFHCKNIPAIDARVNAPRELRYTAARDRGLQKLFTDDFYQHTLAPPAVELTVKNLLPRTEVELAVGDRDDHFAPHHLPLDVRVGVILARIVVSILLDRLVRRELLQPDRIVVVQTRLVVVDKHRSSNVHGIDQG